MKRNEKGQFTATKKGIVIKIERVMTDYGQKGFKILSIEALKEIDLPKEYTTQHPYCYTSTSGCFYMPTGLRSNCTKGGDILVESDFEIFKVEIAKCGTRLQKINKARRELKKTWHGKKTYVV